MDTVVINGVPREGLGKKTARAARKEGQVPCVIYGGGDNVSFTVKPLSVRDLVYTADFKLAEINVDGTSHRCILKDIQFHPVTDNIVHIDFLKLVEGQPIKLEVPVRCEGVSPGVKLGGKLQQNLRKIKIKTTPDKIVDHLTVDISSLELGQAVRVRDINVPEGIEVMNPMANPVAAVEIPRALRSAASKAESGEEKTEE